MNMDTFNFYREPHTPHEVQVEMVPLFFLAANCHPLLPPILRGKMLVIGCPTILPTNAYST